MIEDHEWQEAGAGGLQGRVDFDRGADNLVYPFFYSRVGGRRRHDVEQVAHVGRLDAIAERLGQTALSACKSFQCSLD